MLKNVDTLRERERDLKILCYNVCNLLWERADAEEHNTGNKRACMDCPGSKL